MQDTFLFKIICVTLQSLWFSVEESKSTFSRCFFWVSWIIPTIQTTNLPRCCHLSRFSWPTTSGTINCRGTLSRAFPATCLHTPPTFCRSCPATHIYITPVVFSGVEVRYFGKQTKRFQGLCSRAIYFFFPVCYLLLFPTRGEQWNHLSINFKLYIAMQSFQPTLVIQRNTVILCSSIC